MEYPLLKAAWAKRWPNFKPQEVLSPIGLRQLERGVLLIQPFLLDTLEEFRTELDRPITVNSFRNKHRGYRAHHENAAIGGRAYSYHIQGLAADCSVDGLSMQEFFDRAKSFGWHGIGVYETFLHLDLRPRLDESQVIWTGVTPTRFTEDENGG